MSISSRLALWYMTIIALVLAMFLLAAYWGMNNLLISEASIETNTALSNVIQSVSAPEEGMGESNHIDLNDPDLIETSSHTLLWIQITRPDKTVLQSSGSLGNRVLSPGYIGSPVKRQLLGNNVILAGRKLPGGASVQVARVLTREDRFLSNLLKLLALLGLLGIVVAGIASWVLTSNALKPVAALTQTMLDISVTDLNQRVAASESRDELQRLAKAFNHMLERVEAGFQKQKEFTAAVSHDLRTPLTVITSYAELLRRWGKNEPAVVEESASSILRSAGYMDRLVNDLLLLSRLEADVALQQTEIWFDEIVGEVVADAQALDEQVTVTLESTSPARVKGDADYLRRAVWVLLDNAVKYNRPGGQVTVSLGVDKNTVTLSVTDTGSGIDADEINKIFDLFYRSDPARSQDQGFGLGLCLARNIVEAHEGHVHVKSDLGKGSIFTITLPRVTTDGHSDKNTFYAGILPKRIFS